MSTLYIFIIILFGVASLVVALTKRRHPIAWAVVGTMFPLVGLLAAILQGSLDDGHR